ncbi:hypothetical protein AX16_007078, partial [Volvariella volvacea WC 439]
MVGTILVTGGTGKTGSVLAQNSTSDNMVGTILVTGGTGKTGSVLAQKLQAAGYSTLVTTRNPSKVAPPLKGVKFDWLDKSTYDNPWNVDPNIDRVYLVLPEIPNDFDYVKPFIDLAVAKGVK